MLVFSLLASELLKNGFWFSSLYLILQTLSNLQQVVVEINAFVVKVHLKARWGRKKKQEWGVRIPERMLPCLVTFEREVFGGNLDCEIQEQG